MATTLTVTEAARNFSDVVNKVFYRGESMDLTRGGKIVARLVPVMEAEAPTGGEVWDAWQSIPHLPTEEADALAKDLEAGRASVNRAPEHRWD